MAADVRPFRIAVRNCRRCSREWPAHLDWCSECAAVLGDVRMILCVRLVPPDSPTPVRPALVVATAIELSRRRATEDRDWAARKWAMLAPRLSSAMRVRPGPAGSIVAAWPVDAAESLADTAELAVELRERVSRGGADNTELRGGIAMGVIDGEARSDLVERVAERLALAAAPGQWLVSDEVARRLEDRFQLRPAGVVPRWPMPLEEDHRALIARLVAPRLPSAVNGEVPDLVLGRSEQQRRLGAELAAAAAGRRRILFVSAPAGGGKSHLLRCVLADADIRLVAGVAFPPLGARPLDPLRSLLAGLGAASDSYGHECLAAALGQAASRRARTQPTAVVADDVHWASPEAITALRRAIELSESDVRLAWILSTRTAALPRLSALTELADVTVDLPPLEPADRTRLLAQRLGAVPDRVRTHVEVGAPRGNPLYLEHLAAAIAEGCADEVLPGTLHEGVLARLDGLVKRAHLLTHWSPRGFHRGQDLEALERELGDWLDRLETSDVADLTTIGRYLARLQAVDVDLLVARSVLRMPVAANRRLRWAVERLAAASTDAVLDYLRTVAEGGRGTQAAYEAHASAARARRTLRLADAERLLAFASQYDSRPELARERGDVALALGRAEDALAAYLAAADGRDGDAELQRRTARAEALLGHVQEAASRLTFLVRRPDLEPRAALAASLDLARLRGLPPSRAGGPVPRRLAQNIARTMAWARGAEPEAAREAIRRLVLLGEPAACAAELIDTAALARIHGINVSGLDAAAAQAVQALNNPHAESLFRTRDVTEARRTFLHCDV